MPRKKSAAKPTGAVKTIAAAAARLAVDERTLKSWLARGCPGGEGKYDTDVIAAWRASHKKPAAATDGERAKWATKKEKAQAQREQIKLRRERGDVIAVARAAQVIRQHVAEVVTHLDQLPDYAIAGSRLPAEAKKKIRERLKEKIRELRVTLEKSLRAVALTARRDGRAESDE